jgi:hypothetical protein
MALQVGDPSLLMSLPFPDIAHDTAAIAVAMDIQYENWHGRQVRSQRHGTLSFHRHKAHFPATLPQPR